MIQQLKSLQHQIDYGLLAALIIPIFAVMPLLLYSGLPNTADGPAHLMRQVELNQAWSQGDYYIRWGADLALGHGMPIFHYTPPLLYQATQVIHLSGLPLDASLKVVIGLGFLLYSGGMYLFARRIFGAYPALLAAAIHVYAPYRLREGYIQGSYGQFIALAFYPVVLWAFYGLVTDGRRRYLLAAALSLAALLLSHNISALHFAPLLAAYLLLLIVTDYAGKKGEGPRSETKDEEPRSRANDHQAGRMTARPDEANPDTKHYAPRTTHHVPRSPLWRVTLAGLLGLALSAIYWLPALAERDAVQFEKITQGFFDFRHNFLTRAELVALPLPLDLAAINPEFPLSLGPAQLVAAAAGVVAILVALFKTFANKGQRPDPSPLLHSLFFAIFFLIFAFLTLPASQPVWEAIPLIELTEFPWRMLGPAIFCASILAAAALSIINEQLPITNFQSPLSNLLIINCALLIVVFLNAYYLYPSQFIPWGTPTPADVFAYEVTTGAIGTNSAAEMLPRQVQQPPQPDALWPDYQAGRPPQKLDPASLPPGATAQTTLRRAGRIVLQVDTPQPFTATLRALYWPGWRVYLNEQLAPFTVTPKTGLIQTEIPAGRHTLTLQLESTPIRTVGKWLTICAAGVLTLLTVLPPLQKATASLKTQNPPVPVRGKPAIATPHPSSLTARAFLAIAVVLSAAYLLSRPLTPLFTLQSNPDHPQPAGRILRVDFGDQLRLVGVDTLPQVVQLPEAGTTTLEAVLYWRALQNLDTSYAVFLHLDAPNGQTLATVDEINPENIPTHSWPPGLYLRNPLRLTLPADLPPIRYNLTTGVYQPQTGQRLPVASGQGDAFSLGAIWLEPPPEETPPAIAGFGPHISLHGARLSGSTLTLLWQTNESIEQNYSIFVHLLDSQGNLLAQADGPPYNGLYPLPDWRPGQLIRDTRLLNLSSHPATIAIGVYDPATGQRLPALDAQGQPLPNHSLSVPVTP